MKLNLGARSAGIEHLRLNTKVRNMRYNLRTLNFGYQYRDEAQANHCCGIPLHQHPKKFYFRTLCTIKGLPRAQFIM